MEEPGGGEGEMLSKVQNPATMKTYFEDFKILMERAKDYGAPVQVLVEADGSGFLQLQAKDDPNTYAAVADSGVPGARGPSQHCRRLGARVPAAEEGRRRGQGADGHARVRLGHEPRRDAEQRHREPRGRGLRDLHLLEHARPGGEPDQASPTTSWSATPRTGDAGYYEKVKGMNKWWVTNTDASLEERSMNRYAEWLRLWNVRSGKRWVLWQIPLGNSNHLDVDNAGGSRQGYKDNRAEYFLGGGIENLQRFADAGVMSLMFGPGMWGMSGYENDYYTDGQLYVKSRAKQVSRSRRPRPRGGSSVDAEHRRAEPRTARAREGDPAERRLRGAVRVGGGRRARLDELIRRVQGGLPVAAGPSLPRRASARARLQRRGRKAEDPRQRVRRYRAGRRTSSSTCSCPPRLAYWACCRTCSKARAADYAWLSNYVAGAGSRTR